MKKKRVYLDYAATTPVDPRVIKSMRPFWSEKFGNTVSLHSFGREAKAALENSRKKIADLIKAKSSEIVFTCSATESNNLALKGVVESSGKKHIVISSIEHPCIMNSAEWLKGQGVEITKVSVDKYGFVNPLDVEKAITKNTALVSVIHASNEIGAIEPIKEIGKICRAKGVPFHTDAAQTFGKLLIDVNKMNIDLLTACSHKIYGPKGAACLFIRQGVGLNPILHGGGQEFGIRSSSVNVSAIVGFAKAAELAEKEMESENRRLISLRDKIISRALRIKGAYLTGHSEKRLPNSASFYFSFVEGESIILHLDLAGIASSTGSACSSQKLEPSHVLLAIGLKPEQAHGSLRVSLGRFTTEQEVDYFLKVLPKVIAKLRKISPLK